jgi:hypothetical protein
LNYFFDSRFLRFVFVKLQQMGNSMDMELKELLERAKGIDLTPAQEEKHRVALAAANGTLSDSRITLETMQATRVLMHQAELQAN